MDVEEIRNAFSKGGIAITDKGIMALYTFKERMISQSIFEESKNVFNDLLKMSDKLVIECVAGKIIKLIFRNDLDGQETVFYSPVSSELTLKELQNLVDNIMSKNINTEFVEFFDGVNLQDDDEVLDKLRELFSMESKEHEYDSVNMSKMVRWKQLRKTAVEFSNRLGLEFDEIEPDYEYNGSVTIPLLEGNRQCVEISGKLKALFEQALDIGSGIDLECSVNDGFLDLTLYA